MESALGRDFSSSSLNRSVQGQFLYWAMVLNSTVPWEACFISSLTDQNEDSKDGTGGEKKNTATIDIQAA